MLRMYQHGYCANQGLASREASRQARLRGAGNRRVQATGFTISGGDVPRVDASQSPHSPQKERLSETIKGASLTPTGKRRRLNSYSSEYTAGPYQTAEQAEPLVASKQDDSLDKQLALSPTQDDRLIPTQRDDFPARTPNTRDKTTPLPESLDNSPESEEIRGKRPSIPNRTPQKTVLQGVPPSIKRSAVRDVNVRMAEDNGWQEWVNDDDDEDAENIDPNSANRNLEEGVLQKQAVEVADLTDQGARKLDMEVQIDEGSESRSGNMGENVQEMGYDVEDEEEVEIGHGNKDEGEPEGGNRDGSDVKEVVEGEHEKEDLTNVEQKNEHPNFDMDMDFGDNGGYGPEHEAESENGHSERAALDNEDIEQALSSPMAKAPVQYSDDDDEFVPSPRKLRRNKGKAKVNDSDTEVVETQPETQREPQLNPTKSKSKPKPKSKSKSKPKPEQPKRTAANKGNESDSDDGVITLSVQKVPTHAGGTKRVNAIDIVSQICSELLGKYTDKLTQKWAVSALTQYTDILNQRFCRLVDMIDLNYSIHQAFKRAESNRNQLRSRLLKLRQRRAKLQLEMQKVRDEYQQDHSQELELKQVGGFMNDIRALRELVSGPSDELVNVGNAGLVQVRQVVSREWGGYERLKSLADRLSDLDNRTSY